LLVGGADPNAANLLGWTPLHFAAVHGSVTNCELLVDKKADKGATTMVRGLSGFLRVLTG